jgi:hypothetical protein
MSRPGIEPGPPRLEASTLQLVDSYSEHLHMSLRQYFVFLFIEKIYSHHEHSRKYFRFLTMFRNLRYNYLLTYDSYGPVYNRFHRGKWITWASGGEGGRGDTTRA